MIKTAFVLAVCSVACCVLIFIKLPVFLQRILIKFQLFSDIMFTFGVGALLSIGGGLTATAIMASAMSGVGISLLLYLEQKRTELN